MLVLLPFSPLYWLPTHLYQHTRLYTNIFYTTKIQTITHIPYHLYSTPLLCYWVFTSIPPKVGFTHNYFVYLFLIPLKLVLPPKGWFLPTIVLCSVSIFIHTTKGLSLYTVSVHSYPHSYHYNSTYYLHSYHYKLISSLLYHCKLMYSLLYHCYFIHSIIILYHLLITFKFLLYHLLVSYCYFILILICI